MPATELLPSGTEEAGARCRGVVKIYWTATGQVHALKGIDAWFAPGAVTAVVGPSGSGKSSLLRVLACVDSPTAGSVSIGGVETTTMSERRRRRIRRRLVGYMFQRPSDNLVPYLSARAQLGVSLSIQRHGQRRWGPELLEILGLGHRARHLPHQLSGGEQQRVALAAAVAPGPRLVVADEPTAELDSASARELMDMVVRLASYGICFVVATHDPVVVRAADQILLLNHGTLGAQTTRSGTVSPIDEAGRIQIPEDLLRRFPDRRAVIEPDRDGIRIAPPPVAGTES